jgi:hypothetical protein
MGQVKLATEMSIGGSIPETFYQPEQIIRYLGRILIGL